MIKTYRRIWGLFTQQERRRFLLLMLATFVMSVFEVAGVGAIMPFLAALADPTLFDTNPALRMFTALFGLDTPQAAMIGLGVAVLVIVVVGMGVRALVTYFQFRFALMRAYSLASRLLHGYLSQDYVWYLSRNSSDLSTNLLSEVDLVVRDSILPLVLAFSNLLVVVMIGVLLFLVSPGVAIGATGLLAAVYLSVFWALRNRMARLGEQRVKANQARFLAVQEITGGLKMLKVMGTEAQSLRRFRIPAQALAEFQTVTQVMGRLPRFAVEGAFYAGFVLMVLVLVLVRGQGVTSLLPLFGLLGMAATRLFPALQTFYQTLARMRVSAPALMRLEKELTEMKQRPLPEDMTPPLPLENELALVDLHFSYPEGNHPTLQGLDLAIPARSTVGLVGGTGAGKTTIIDVILGLLQPDAGALTVDGVALTPDTLRAWQQNIGYVPQHIFLLDDSVAANIALGDPAGPDMAKVERAARIAHLHDFITSELPDGYDARVGERGVRLSGGQQQRIDMIGAQVFRGPGIEEGVIV